MLKNLVPGTSFLHQKYDASFWKQKLQNWPINQTAQ